MMRKKKEDSETRHCLPSVLKEQGEASSSRRKKHNRSSETKLTPSGSDRLRNLQPNSQFKGLRSFDESLVATMAPGYEE